MRRSGLTFFLFLASLACASAGAAPPQSPPPQDETRRLRDELVKARLENLSLKLRLARLAAKPDDELKILEEALDADLPEVVGAAFRELTALPEDRRKALVPAVLQRFRGGRDTFRVDAVDFLGRVPEAESTVIASAADGSPAVRKAVAGALKTASTAGAAETLLLLYRDPDREVRLAALDALGVAKRDAAVAPLASALASEKDPLIVEKTVDALGAIGSFAAADALIELLGTTARETIRWSCINSLGKIGDPKAGPRLLSYMDPPQPLDVRQVTIESLGKLKETSALPRLAEVLKKDSEEKLRQAAAAAFGLMAGVGTIDDTLLPAYLSETSDAVRRAIWSSMLSLAGDGFIPNEKLVLAFFVAGRRNEMDQVCTRIHALKPEGELKARRIALEETVAKTFFESNDFKGALPHCRQVAVLAPERVDAARRVAACQRELKDLDGCLRTLSELKDSEPLLEETAAQLQTNLTEDRRKTLEGRLRSGTIRLIEPLGTKDEAARKGSLDAIRRLGRKILPALIAELEEGPKTPAPVLEAGQAITGIPNEPGNPNGFKAKAAAWRAWLEK